MEELPVRTARQLLMEARVALEPLRTTTEMPEVRELSLAITHLEDADLRLQRALGLA